MHFLHDHDKQPHDNQSLQLYRLSGDEKKEKKEKERNKKETEIRLIIDRKLNIGKELEKWNKI